MFLVQKVVVVLMVMWMLSSFWVMVRVVVWRV